MALRKEPARRYASVGAARGRPAAPPRGLPVRARKDTSRYRRASSCGATATRWGLRPPSSRSVAGFGVNRASALRGTRPGARSRLRQEAETARQRRLLPAGRLPARRPVAARRLSSAPGRSWTVPSSGWGSRSYDRPEVRAALLDTLGDVYRHLGLYSQCESHCSKEALALRRGQPGREETSTPRAASSILASFAASSPVTRRPRGCSRRAVSFTGEACLGAESPRRRGSPHRPGGRAQA